MCIYIYICPDRYEIGGARTAAGAPEKTGLERCKIDRTILGTPVY